MKYFTIAGIIAHIAVILYLIFSFVIGDINFINWEQDYRLNYILSLILSLIVSLPFLFSCATWDNLGK